MIRVVFDTNIYISALAMSGSVRKVLNSVRNKQVKLFASVEILLELTAKLRHKFLWSEERINFTIETIGLLADMVEPKEKIKAVKVDSSDDKILECAIEAQVDYIVTGDKDLLNLKQFREIKIITPAQFLTSLS